MRAASGGDDDGLRALWFAILGATVYRRLVLLARRLDGDVPTAVARVSVTIEMLQPDELGEYARFRGAHEGAAARRRLGAGHWCFVARHQGTIVHAGWAIAGTAWIDYLGCALPLSPGEVFQYGSFTTPAFRGANIATARVAEMAGLLRARGYRWLVAAVLPENAAAFRPLQKLGYRPAGWIGVIGLGRRRHIVGSARDGAVVARGSGHAKAPPAYWDAILEEFRRAPPLAAWRAYMHRVYARLIAEWLSPPTARPALKTDLFEEAITCHQILGDLGPGSLGLDFSPAIARAARGRVGRDYRFAVADLRQIPLRTGSIGRILAGSSLDHFSDSRDIDVCLAELTRVLAPGGVLVITFDNPRNPMVWLRNRLPFGWLHRLRLVPYYVGVTYGRVEAARALAAVGLRVTHLTAVAHAPRAPAIWLAALTDRLSGSAARRFLERSLERWEILGRLPTRYWTGYYVVLRAERDAMAGSCLDRLRSAG